MKTRRNFREIELKKIENRIRAIWILMLVLAIVLLFTAIGCIGNEVESDTTEHGSCILTNEAALVLPVLYHINGKTFGGGHVPDPEEMVHMLVYFQ